MWRQIQRRNFTRLEPFLSYLELEGKVPTSASFPLNVPMRLAQKIKKKDWHDPILLQFLPSFEEEKVSPLFLLDPVHDAEFQKTPKLLHKYQGRALLLCSSACAMHCRYCFRKNSSYETARGFEEELAEIQRDPTLHEILLSGGDPLSLGEVQLGELLRGLDAIDHVKRLRFHTRFPIGIPERIDAPFLEQLAGCKKQVIFVIHVNHVRELDEEIVARLKAIQRLGIPVLSQSVLLKGVNDRLETLCELFEGLIGWGILPYYLHQLDRVQGAEHFEVSEEEGKRLMAQLQERLPGYGVPRYVKEEPHKAHKTSV